MGDWLVGWLVGWLVVLLVALLLDVSRVIDNREATHKQISMKKNIK